MTFFLWLGSAIFFATMTVIAMCPPKVNLPEQSPWEMFSVSYDGEVVTLALNDQPIKLERGKRFTASVWGRDFQVNSVGPMIISSNEDLKKAGRK